MRSMMRMRLAVLQCTLLLEAIAEYGRLFALQVVQLSGAEVALREIPVRLATAGQISAYLPRGVVLITLKHVLGILRHV